MAHTRECLLCHQKYERCYCDEKNISERWKMLFHDNNCRIIFNTLQRYSTKEITAKEAIKVLETCDLSVMENATESVKKDLAAIMAQKEEVKPVVEKISVKKTPKLNNDNN